MRKLAAVSLTLALSASLAACTKTEPANVLDGNTAPDEITDSSLATSGDNLSTVNLGDGNLTENSAGPSVNAN